MVQVLGFGPGNASEAVKEWLPPVRILEPAVLPAVPPAAFLHSFSDESGGGQRRVSSHAPGRSEERFGTGVTTAADRAIATDSAEALQTSRAPTGEFPEQEYSKRFCLPGVACRVRLCPRCECS